VELNLKAAYLSKQTQNSSRPLSFKHSLQGHSDAGLLGDTVGFLPKRAGGGRAKSKPGGSGGCRRCQAADCPESDEAAGTVRAPRNKVINPNAAARRTELPPPSKVGARRPPRGLGSPQPAARPSRSPWGSPASVRLSPAPASPEVETPAA